MVAFGSEVARICPFTTDRERVRAAVNRLRPGGATRFYDAVAEALELLDRETGRRAVLALTDGEDTFSQSANLDSTIASARKLGLPVHTLGLGTEEEIESGDLKRLASSTRGQYYPAQQADQLRSIYETASPPASVPATASSIRATAACPTAPSAPSALLPRQPQGGRDRRLHPRHGRARRRLVHPLPLPHRSPDRPGLLAGLAAPPSSRPRMNGRQK